MRIAVLGSTGSIGTQTLDVCRLFPDRLTVAALAAHRSVDAVEAQAREFRPEVVAMGDADAARELARRLAGTGIRVEGGMDALDAVAASPSLDAVVAALVGAAGLSSTLAAVRAGTRVALANKESLVVGGALVTEAARASGADLLPVDSEHSAIFQCLVGEPGGAVDHLILTGSGGPFRTRDLATFGAITPAEALRHPTWAMGAKITIDSATMMNKGLEIIEARWLFEDALGGADVARYDDAAWRERLRVVLHPTSVVHSMVVFVDGSAKAQLGPPSMVVPIQLALSWPDRWPAPHARLEVDAPFSLDFTPPDEARYPALGLAYDALGAGGAVPAVLNAANEVAVARFLDGALSFPGIAATVATAMDAAAGRAFDATTLDGLLDADAWARAHAARA